MRYLVVQHPSHPNPLRTLQEPEVVLLCGMASQRPVALEDERPITASPIGCFEWSEGGQCLKRRK